MLERKKRRLWAAIEASAYGYGGSTLVWKVIGTSTATIYKGIKELKTPLKMLVELGKKAVEGGFIKSHKLVLWKH